jgi:CheY-like chemotaxis protein
MLQMRGYTVLDTGDPQVAVDLTKKHAIHLLLADVVMPLMTGPELARRVQALSP